jgi:hypothetical protein
MKVSAVPSLAWTKCTSDGSRRGASTGKITNGCSQKSSERRRAARIKPVPHGQKTERRQFLKTAVRFRLFEFCIGRTGLGSNDSRGNNHSDEGEGNQNIMHG